MITQYCLKGSLLISLVLLGLLIQRSITAQICVTQSDIAGELKNRAPAADGKIHVTYSFNDSNISASAKKAIENAFTQWNNKSDTTKVFFEPARPGTSGDLEFKPSTDIRETGGCAGYRSNTGRVYYSRDWETRAAKSEAPAQL